MTSPLQRTTLRPRRSRLAAEAAQPITAPPNSAATIANPMKNRMMWAMSGVQKTLVWPRLT